jgi:predicted ArsR family transcriptional regulator
MSASQRVLSVLRFQTSITAVQLAEWLSLHKHTVTKAIYALREEGYKIVAAPGKAPGRRSKQMGRPESRYSLVAEGRAGEHRAAVSGDP